MNAAKNIFTVFKREFFGYFNSPVAYIILVIFQLSAMGLCFFFGSRTGPLLDTDNASLAEPFFMWHPWIYFVLTPAVGMRLWSEEQRLGTMELLMTMPISTWQAVLGKYFAAATVWFIGLLLTFPVVFTVYYLGNPDSGPIISGYIASAFYGASCLAITCAVSAFTRSQVICFIISVAICFLLFLLGMPPIVEGMVKSLPAAFENVVRFVAYLCFLTHYFDMSKGLVLFKDVLYFLSVIVFSLMVTHYAIQNRRA